MLRVEKRKIGELNKCYALTTLSYKGAEHILVAAEKNDPCYLYTAAGDYVGKVWDGPGGVMTMKQVPGTDGVFLTTQKFYSPNDSQEAYLAVVEPSGDEWQIRKVADLPFVHRFDIVEFYGEQYITLCTLKSDHQHKDDFSAAGKVYLAKLPADWAEYNEQHQLQFEVVADDLHHNHGYSTYQKDGRTQLVISADEGVFLFDRQKDGKFKVERLIREAISDAVLVDFRKDGNPTLCTIGAFHGEKIRFYDQVDGKYQLSYTHAKAIDFLHGITTASISGVPYFFVGARKDERDLLAFSLVNGKYEYQEIDSGAGAANLLFVEHAGKSTLWATNREVDEIAAYDLELVE